MVLGLWDFFIGKGRRENGAGEILQSTFSCRSLQAPLSLLALAYRLSIKFYSVGKFFQKQ